MNDKMRLEMVLNFARCPYCMQWRSPEKAEKYKDSVKCFDCNVPEELQPILKREDAKIVTTDSIPL